MQAFSMRDFNFKSDSIAISLYVLENLSSFNQVFFSQMHAFFLSKICNFSQKYALENALNFCIHIKKCNNNCSSVKVTVRLMFWQNVALHSAKSFLQV